MGDLSPQLLLQRLADRGIRITTTDGTGLRVEPWSATTEEEREALRANKGEILAFLAAPAPPAAPEASGEGQGVDEGAYPPPTPLDLEQVPALVTLFTRFRQEFGAELASQGWNRESVFGRADFDPATMRTVDDLPGVLAMLANGARVVSITRARILFQDCSGSPVARLREGWFLAGNALAEWDARKQREKAERPVLPSD